MANTFWALARGLSTRAAGALVALFLLLGPVTAHAALSITPITWDIVGLDSNSPATGPKNFPVGARVCSTTATTNVQADFVWDSANALINLRAGSLATITFANIAAGQCADAYFEIEVTQDAAAFDTTRRYRITATDSTGTVATPAGRQLYVEHLVSQSRNAITNLRYGTTPANLQSVAAGGSLDLVVGNTYLIELNGSTATQGYEQLEAFINFTNTIFQVLDVDTTYSADTSPIVSNPNDKLYADACGWEADPNSPNYRACLGVGKNGGTITTLYTIRIIGGGGTSQTLNTLVYDFSGSSYHYNADFSAGARFANVIDPAVANIAKSFAPNPATVNGVSVLTITLSNPNAGALPGFAFVDNLPANMTIAATPGVTTSGCGTPTVTAPANGSTITFSNGTVAGLGACTIRVNVTTSTTGTFTNTTNNLFVGGVDTGKTATAQLTVNNDPPPGTGVCGLNLATWRFPSGFNVNTPAASTSTVTAAAVAGAGLAPVTRTSLSVDGTLSWGSNGSITPGAFDTANNEYFEFSLVTTGLTSVSLAFNAERRTPNGPSGIAVFSGTTAATVTTQLYNNANALPSANTATPISGITANGAGLNSSGTTFFRVYYYNSGNTNTGSDAVIDDVVFTGCGAGTKPTIAKAFSPNPIAAGASSTLAFTLTNTNPSALTGAAFTDSLPAGLSVATTPAATNTCGGTFTAAASSTSVSLTGGTIPASGSCTLSVNVTAATPGTFNNTSGFLSTTETGTSTGGVATATLVALQPAIIAKNFSPDPILANGVSRLTFSITNPNLGSAIAGVAFTDTFPVTPGAMVVAPTPNPAIANCGAATFAPVAGAGSVSFSNGAIAAGTTCLVSVNVTAPTVGNYTNTSSAVTYLLNGLPVVGNTASDTLGVTPPSPGVSLLKQVGLSATGPWLSFQPVNLPGSVFYRFTVENLGDVPLTSVAISDPTVPTACTFPATLPVADALDDDHIAACVVGPVAATSGSTTNTATVNAIGGGVPVNDVDSAVYASTGLSLVKSSVQSTFTAAGDVINYTFLVTNSGFATLAGPVIVSDDRTSDEACPALSTIGDLDNFFDPGESITCTASYVITAGDASAGFVTNNATATSGGATSNQSTRTVTLIGPRLDVAKNAAPVPFVAGSTAAYTITVTNNGTAATTGNITVADNLPAGVTLSSATGTNWGCTGTTALSCTFTGTLAIGASTTLTLNVNVAPTATTGANSATASGGGDPTCPARTGCTGTVDVPVAAPLLSTSKIGTVDNTVIAPNDQSNIGDRINYTITVANGGNGPATNVTVADPKIAALACTINAVPTPLPATIPAGASLVCTGSYTLVDADVIAGSVSNTATVTGGNVCNPTSAGSTCSASADTPLGVVPVLITTKVGVLDDTVVAPDSQSNVGDEINYTITVQNTGNATANDVDVVDPKVALACSIGGVPTGLPTALAAGATLTCTGTYVLVAADITAGSVANTATTTGTGVCNPTSLGSVCSDSATTPLTLAAVLTLAKTGVANNAVVAPNNQSNVGDTIAYTITVANGGNGPATNVGVSDPLVPVLACSIGGSPATLPATLAAGASLVCTGTYTLVAADISNGSVTNTATVAGGNACNPTSAGSTCSDTEQTPLALLPVLALDKVGVANNAVVAPNDQSNVGDTIAYTITVSNSGNTAAQNVVVTDPRLATIACTIGGVNAPLPATLAAGASLVCTGTYTLTGADVSAGSVANTATVSATNACNPSSAGSTCTDSVTTPLALVPVLTTTKSGTLDNSFVAPLDQSNPGDRIGYVITVANSGNGPANAVTVSDPLLPTLACSIAGTPTALPTTLAAGASLVCTGTYTLTAADVTAGSVSNTATVSGGNVCNPTTAGSTCSATANTPLALAAILSTTKTSTLNNAVVAPNDQSNVGDTIAYTITVANSGNTAATNVGVNDPLLATLACSIGGSPVTLPTSLAAGASLVCTGTYTLTQADVTNGSVSNTATVTAGNVCNPTTMGSTCTATRITPLGLVPVLTLDKAAVANNAVVAPANQSNPGDTIAYTITVANSGNADATGVSVSDPRLPTLACSIGGSPATLPTTLAAGASLVCTGTYTLVAGDVTTGSVSNTATVTAGNACNPTSLGSTCSDTVSTPLALAAVLSIDKSATLDNAVVAPNGESNAGDRIAYTIIVTSSGNTAATAVTVSDPRLPTLACTVAGSPTALPTTLAPNATLACTGTYTLTTADIANGSVANTAVTSATNACNPTSFGSTCSDTVSTPLTPVQDAPIDLAVTKTHGGTFVAGQPGGSYTLVVSNVGGTASAGPVTVVDTLPTGLVATSISGTGWTCTLATLTCTRSDALAAGAAYPAITLGVSVAPNAAGSIVNTATVSGGGDSNPNNNTDGDSVVVGGDAPVPVPVPVDSRLALMLLALAMLVIGGRARRRA